MKKSIFAMTIFAICCITDTSANDKVNTTRKNLTAKTTIEQLECLNNGESRRLSDSISISGYDKTVTAKNESFYLTNNTEFHLSKAVIKFTYKTLSGEMLHEETYSIDCDIPPRSTKLLTVESWDKAHSHYYHKSRKPKRSAVPYTVSYTLLRCDIAIKLESD